MDSKMNERIKELASEAEDYADSIVDQGGEFHEAYTKKFAKLIVKECIETMRLVPYESDREFGDEIIYQEAVKKHFGVEE
jgi:argininosuccinate lyase